MSDPDRRILELEEQVSNLLRIKRELERKVEELTPRRMYQATLSPDKLMFWIEYRTTIHRSGELSGKQRVSHRRKGEI
jgi:hypothetical protein